MKRIEIGRTNKKHRISSFLNKRLKPKRLTTLLFYICILAFLLVGIQSTISSFVRELNNFSVFALGSDGYNLTTEIPSDAVQNHKTASKQNISYSNEFEMLDRRAYVFDQYFKSYNSPLYGTGKYFVQACIEAGAPSDCITIVAIAKHESNLCTYPHSAEMFNCWGWGGGAQYRVRFSSFEESIFRVTKETMRLYGSAFFVDPEIAENVYCGPQAECEGWGDRVKIIMRDINSFSINLGYGSLF